jgi:hypothetical protein
MEGIMWEIRCTWKGTLKWFSEKNVLKLILTKEDVWFWIGLIWFRI